MSTSPYGIQLERALASMKLAKRLRDDPGDLDALAQSMSEHGLLQLPTITPEGVVLIGERRYLAAQQLKWHTMPVWVRSGLSDELGLLLVRHADHVSQKPLNQLEAARLYRELKRVLEEEAARRQAATQFQPDGDNGGFAGGRDSRPPANPPNSLGKSSRKAAQLITGRDASQRLERICRIEDLAENPDASESVRAEATAEVDRIKTGGRVNASHLRMNAALTLDQIDQIASDPTVSEAERDLARSEAERVRQSNAKAADMERLAQDALHRVRSSRSARTLVRPRPERVVIPVLYSARAFMATWGELDQWWSNYDPEQIARELTDEQITLFYRVAAGTTGFADQLRTARTRLTA